jgi:hypothetical protein
MTRNLEVHCTELLSKCETEIELKKRNKKSEIF